MPSDKGAMQFENDREKARLKALKVINELKARLDSKDPDVHFTLFLFKEEQVDAIGLTVNSSAIQYGASIANQLALHEACHEIIQEALEQARIKSDIKSDVFDALHKRGIL